MTDFTPPVPSLRLYQTSHVIAPVATGSRVICAVDGIRVFPRTPIGWRHDPAEVVALFDAWVATAWPGTKEQALERVLATVPEDLDEDEPPEYDREGDPAFNGSFR